MVRQEAIMKWETPEYEHKPKSVSWLIGLVIVSTSGVILALIANNPLLAFLVFGSALMFGIFSNREPGILTVQISSHGIKVGDTFYIFDTLESFWLNTSSNSDSPPVLLLKSKKPLMPIISIPVSDISDLSELRNLLIEVMTEEEMREPFPHQVMDRLGL